MYTSNLLIKLKFIMKKLLIFISPILFLISCNSGGVHSSSSANSIPDVLGCMEDCAVNYLETANIDDGSCIYDFTRTYVMNAYTIMECLLFLLLLVILIF